MSDTFASTADGIMPGVSGSPTPEDIRARQSAFHQASGQQPPTPQGLPPQQAFTLDDINAAREAARREEKDKLYPQLEEMRNELKEIKDERERLAREKAEAAAAAEAASREAREKEMNGKQLAETVRSELTERISVLENELAIRDAISERERKFHAIEEYKRQQLAVHGAEIIPNLHDLVQGGTQEEIDASIASLKARSGEIPGVVQQTQQQAFSAMRGVAPTGMPPAAGPMDNEDFERQITPGQVYNMSDAEYSRHRPQLLAWTSRQHRGQQGR